MDLTKISSHLIQFIPLVISTVKAAIETVESEGNGLAKTEGALRITETTLRAALPGNSTAQDIAELIGYARALIPVVVGVYNTIGKFISSKPAQPAQVPAPSPSTPPPSLARISAITGEIKKLKEQLSKLDPNKAADKKKYNTKQGRIILLEAELAELKSA